MNLPLYNSLEKDNAFNQPLIIKKPSTPYSPNINILVLIWYIKTIITKMPRNPLKAYIVFHTGLIFCDFFYIYVF